MYDYGNYSAKLEKRVVINKIMRSTNQNMGYSDYTSFKKDNKLDNVMKHFGDRLTDVDFKEILSNMLNNNDYSEDNMYDTKSQSKQLGLKTTAGALFKEE